MKSWLPPAPCPAMSQAPAIGIDLGTTYSCVAVWQNDRVTIIENDQGNRTTPSVVAFTPSERIVGEAAVGQALRNQGNTVFGECSALALSQGGIAEAGSWAGAAAALLSFHVRPPS